MLLIKIKHLLLGQKHVNTLRVLTVGFGLRKKKLSCLLTCIPHSYTFFSVTGLPNVM